MTLLRFTLAALFALAPVAGLLADDEKPMTKPAEKADKPADKLPDLTGFKTVKEAQAADMKVFKSAVVSKPTTPGYIGVVLADKPVPTIDAVAADSPAEKAGLKAGDVIAKVGGDAVTNTSQARDRLRGLVADEKMAVTVQRDGQPVEVAVTPKPTSKPFTTTGGGGGGGGGGGTPARALLGVRIGDTQKEGGVPVDSITKDGAADKAGIKEKDVLVRIDDQTISDNLPLSDILGGKKPGDVVKVLVRRDGKEMELKATLAGEPPASGGGQRAGFGGGWDDRLPGAWKKTGYKLAVIGIEYPDQKHNDKIMDCDWEESMFSDGTYTGKSATGQKVFGSMADYYKEISCGTFKVEGSFVGWVEVSKKRMEYSSGNGTSTREKTALLSEAMDLLLKKDKDAMKDFDGVFFLFAGGRVNTTRGSLYWPHRASFRHNNKSWPYFIVQEGGDRMTDISVFCHEFGHMLGLPDLYARPEQPGMEGVGVWCAMSQQLPNGRPQHFSAWSKEQLGWIKPTVIDPRVKQKLILSPIENSPTECFKVPIKADGSEYLLLENRQKKGWDTELPAAGLLVWRVLPGNATQRVFLEESHGIEGPTGPRQFPGAVPFPSPANDSFTPYTTPSSKAQTGGGYDVYITNVRRLPDGRITFLIGYEYQ